MKRLKQATSDYSYNQVSFQYGDDAAPAQHGPNPQTPDEAMAAEQEFILPRNFEVPPSLALPDTMKQHAIIEKTARFIASQGIQMEILLKAKQSNNMQFEFLTQNSTLNPYYRHMCTAIKNGTYPSQSVEVADIEPIDSKTEELVNSFDITDNAHFKSVPTIKYKPSENCAYTQLISKIKGVPVHDVISENNAKESMKTPSPPPTPTMTVKPKNDTSPQVEILKNTSALALAQNYDSDTESDDNKDDDDNDEKTNKQLNFPIPTDNLKNIIDKTATYVIKNGRKFEETLRCKSEERFMFLLTDNEYYPYYLYKVTGDPDAASKEQKTRRAAAVAAALMSRKGIINAKNQQSIAPVSFMIKPKDEMSGVTLPPAALPRDHSDDEHDNEQDDNRNSRQVPEQVKKAIQLVESQLMARNSQMVLNVPILTGAGSSSKHRSHENPSNVKQHNSNNNNNISNSNSIISSSSKNEQERNAQFEQQQQNRNKEMRKEKVKDKLAQIAREKLCGLISKEKQLQLERKRKAMAFLNQIKSNSPSETQITSPTTETASGAPSMRNNGSDSDTSVHSIPITSYGPDDDDLVQEESKLEDLVGSLPAMATTKAKETMATVTVSDDDDCQLVSETRPHNSKYSKRRRRSGDRYGKTRESKKSHESTISEGSRTRHGMKRKKSKKSQGHSRSRSRSRDHRSRSHHSRQSPSKRSSRNRSHSRDNNSSSDDDSDERSRRRRHHRRTRQ